MKINLITLAFICLTANLAFAAPIGIAVPEKKFSAAPINPRFAEYMINKISSGYDVTDSNDSANPVETNTFDFRPGLVPEPFILPHSNNMWTVSASGRISSLPTAYDLRTKGKLTAIRNQGGCGSCWAFAAYGSLESSLLPGESWDFSENNLKNRHGYDLSCCEGGNRAMTVAYLARWEGPVSETDDPYPNVFPSCTSASGLTPRKHVQDVLFLPDRTSSTDNETIKNAVMNYGAVYTVFYWAATCYNSSTKGFYCSSLQVPNHAVCIVGWNDDFSKFNFPSTAPGNGAFFIRNSWGSWGDAGYFWISYYDANLGKPYNANNPNENAIFLAQTTDNYDTQYGYDKLGLVNMIGCGSETAWAAMVFTPTTSGVLQAASTYFLVDNTSYELRIYKNPGTTPTSGTLMSTKTGTVSIAGYHTIDFDTPVLMASGTKYACVIKLTTPGYNNPIGYEFPYDGYYTATATANAGETYISGDGLQWQDTISFRANASVCLKAFASHPIITSLANIKGTYDGDYVRLDGVKISAIYSDCLYVQDPNVPIGIRVDASSTGYNLGDVVTVVGTIGTYRPDGIQDAEREIQSAFVSTP